MEIEVFKTEILELKSIVSEIKNVLEVINSRLNETELLVRSKTSYLKTHNWMTKKESRRMRKINGKFSKVLQTEFPKLLGFESELRMSSRKLIQRDSN